MRMRVAQQIGVAFALTLFAVSLAAGIVADVDGTTVLIRSVVVMVVAYPIGCTIGRIAAFTLNEHLTLIHAPRRAPDSGDETDAIAEVAVVDETGES